MTRHFWMPLAMALVLASCSPATPPPAPAADAAPDRLTSAEAEAQVTKLEHDWVAAIVKKDAAAIEALLADDFNGTSPTAHVYPKSLAIEDLRNGNLVVESMVLDEVAVNTYGDVAVAFTSQEEKSRYGDIDTSGHYHYTNVWLRRDGRWQVVASHGSRFESPHTK
jgi:ketosteroid isomerase-like protein